MAHLYLVLLVRRYRDVTTKESDDEVLDIVRCAIGPLLSFEFIYLLTTGATRRSLAADLVGYVTTVPQGLSLTVQDPSAFLLTNVPGQH